MKKNQFIPALLFLLSSNIGFGQAINWNRINEQKHIVNINIAADYALNYGMGYAYKIKSKRPTLLNAEYSFSSGGKLADDFKIKTGTQIRWWQSGNFQVASKLQAVFRRFHNDYARLLNFGADLSSSAGYYKHHWFAAAEIGFDKAIFTHFRHSDLYKANFPGVRDGWYEPSTGGNFYYGLQGGWSGKNKDVYINFGKLIQQDFSTAPMIPFYAEFGFNLRLK